MFDCSTCGACCRAFGIVEIVEADEVPEELTIITELGYYRMKPDGFTCCCLGANNHCKIYPERPMVCRRLVVGGDLCLMARKKEGIS